MRIRALTLLLGALIFGMARAASAETSDNLADWTVYITNDTCPDYTWGFSEEVTRRSFAELVRAHLDEMQRTDGERAENRDRYNMAVTQEALCFVEKYPERRDELVRRIREGRVFVSPFLNNSLWGFQSVEGMIRTLYPARRLEREWGMPMTVAHHIELPSLPWGVASILAGCGVRWLLVPFYDFDSTFAGLKNPPLFAFEGPDGARLRVIMDPWASGKWSYAQGAALLGRPELISREWLPHYAGLGEEYPLHAVLASGTHSDYSPQSASQAPGFADAIIHYNATPGPHPGLVNATLPQFTEQVDQAEARRPFLKVLRGSFGNSWESWPVSLAKCAAAMREGERRFLAAETLTALAGWVEPSAVDSSRADRERAEWDLAMLGDHAWNGTDDTNKQVNAELRRRWAEELLSIDQRLTRQAWARLGLKEGQDSLMVFNSLSFPRAGLVCVEPPPGVTGVAAGTSALNTQWADEDGRHVLCFVSPQVEGFGFKCLHLTRRSASPARAEENLRSTDRELGSPYYSLTVDPATGGLASLVWKANGRELLKRSQGRTVGQTLFFDGHDHPLEDVRSEVVSRGPVLARLKIAGRTAGIDITTFVTVYADLDQVDFDMRIKKPVSAREQRLTHTFPVIPPDAILRIETTGAVVRPQLQPAGDMLPGSDLRRFVVQGFVDASLAEGEGVALAPLDSFLLRADLDAVTFEALGNDQDYKEVIRDQAGETEFRFRYSLRAHGGGYQSAGAFAWSRSVATPLLTAWGEVPQNSLPRLVVDRARAIATALKPADEGSARGVIVRLWETGGTSGPLRLGAGGFRRAYRCDLLERDLGELKMENGRVAVPLRANGFGSVGLVR
ncbi:MAG: glycosyl hydrolase-related protein [Terriglobia bacterium]